MIEKHSLKILSDSGHALYDYLWFPFLCFMIAVMFAMAILNGGAA